MRGWMRRGAGWRQGRPRWDTRGHEHKKRKRRGRGKGIWALNTNNKLSYYSEKDVLYSKRDLSYPQRQADAHGTDADKKKRGFLRSRGRCKRLKYIGRH